MHRGEAEGSAEVNSTLTVSPMRHHTMALRPANGTGVKVIEAGLKIIKVFARRGHGFALNLEHFPGGSNDDIEHNAMMPADELEQLKAFDAIFFCAVGAPQLPDHVILWGLRLALCQAFDRHADVRPVCPLPDIAGPLTSASPADLDWIILLENSEGEYSGHGDRAHRGLPEAGGTEASILTRAATPLIVCQFIIAPLSNGCVVILINLAIFFDLPWDLILSAENFQNNKPHPKTYLGNCDLLSLEPGQLMPVAAHNHDLAAARALGLKTAFIPRPTEYGPLQTKDFGPEQNWDIVADSLTALADNLAS